MNKTFPPIYSLDKSKRTRIWQIEVADDSFRTIEGLIDGKQTVSKFTKCLPKNKGKANYRNGFEQAIAEAESKWQKKLEQNGSLDQHNIVQKFFEPMLAKKYQDEKHKIVYPVIVQPKLDGGRCIIYLKDGKPYAQTRKGEEIVSIPHILDELKDVLEEGMVLDGELYNHSLKNEFEKIMSIIRKQKVTKKQLEESKNLIEYHVYDIAGKHSVWPMVLREGLVHDLLNDSNKFNKVKIVPSVYVDNEAELFEQENKFISMGYEGLMIRFLNSSYVHGRTESLLKMKRFDDAEFLLVDLEEGVGNRSGLATRAIMALPDGKTFGVGVNGEDGYSRDLLTNKEKYKNKYWTVKYFGVTSDNIPRFGKLLRIRDF
jgi:ATP-dependent DNA ligase